MLCAKNGFYKPPQHSERVCVCVICLVECFSPLLTRKNAMQMLASARALLEEHLQFINFNTMQFQFKTMPSQLIEASFCLP